MRIYTHNKKNDKQNISHLIIIFLFLLLLLYGSILLLDHPGKYFTPFMLILIPIFIIYGFIVLLVVKNPEKIIISSAWFIIFAVVVRIFMIMHEPALSDDVYRYVWDGRVSAHGINPYQYPPEHTQLDFLKDREVYTSINYPGIATVYPPAAQLFFLINYFLGDSIWSWKIMLLFMETLLTIILLNLIRVFKLHALRILIFTLNPLVIIETYMNGHLELIGLVFLWLAIYLFYKKKPWQALIVLLPAILVKFFPLLIYLSFMTRKFWRQLIFVFIAVILIIVPFTLSDTIPMAGFFSYVNRWSFNAAAFKMLTSLLYILPVQVIELGSFDLNGHLEIFYLNQEFYYKMIAGTILLLVIIIQLRKSCTSYDLPGINPMLSGFIITGTFLLLTPTFHPWYLIWIIPFLIFLPNWGWISFSFLIMLSYQVLEQYYSSGVWLESGWILAIEYIPFYFILIYEYLYHKNIRGWLL